MGYGGLVMYAGNGTGAFANSSADNHLPGGSGAMAGDLNLDASLCSSEYVENANLQISALQTLLCIKT